MNIRCLAKHRTTDRRVALRKNLCELSTELDGGHRRLEERAQELGRIGPGNIFARCASKSERKRRIDFRQCAIRSRQKQTTKLLELLSRQSAAIHTAKQ